jgi:DnaK suppressor protein
MTRRNALLRLHKHLLARREELGEKLAGELSYLNDANAGDGAGDNADLALVADGDEMASWLAELSDKELGQIRRALARWNQGSYGICESCEKPISLARLNALPCTPFCILCEREMEQGGVGTGLKSKGNWGQVADTQALMQDERVNLSELERVLSGSEID